MLALMRMLLCTYVSLGALLCACQANSGTTGYTIGRHFKIDFVSLCTLVACLYAYIKLDRMRVVSGEQGPARRRQCIAYMYLYYSYAQCCAACGAYSDRQRDDFNSFVPV